MAPTSPQLRFKSKLKVQLKLSISRLRNIQAKDTAISKQQRRQMAQLLEIGKEESARIRVENIIRTDITVELYEILELYCELLLARLGLLDTAPPPNWINPYSGKEGDTRGYVDPGLEEAVNSIIYAAARTEIKELQMTRMILMDRCGKDYSLRAMENRDNCVPERVEKKLRAQGPGEELVTMYLKEIARTYGVDWPKGENRQQDEDDDDEPSGGQKVQLEAPLEAEGLSQATPPRDFDPKGPVRVAPPSPSSDNVRPKLKLPGPPEAKPKSTMEKGTSGGFAKKDIVGGKIPEVDELARRFAALKR
ncbi:MAG: hypothetical protein M1834_009540 [Cirrosporium novae-zelandiae]|nr:MAG: hypothetical protein M1834_009540 [Cirrosporium novae-zelandiae]